MRNVRRLYLKRYGKAVATEDVHRVVAGVALPNAASITLHRRLGFQDVGVFTEVGLKFDRYWDVRWFERPLSR